MKKSKEPLYIVYSKKPFMISIARQEYMAVGKLWKKAAKRGLELTSLDVTGVTLSWELASLMVKGLIWMIYGVTIVYSLFV